MAKMNNAGESPKFSTLYDQLSSFTALVIQHMGYKRMTCIQAEVLPRAIKGVDLQAIAKTGSGKTLAFLIPAVEAVKNFVEGGGKGTFCIIISPTRELAMQTFSVLQEFTKHHIYLTSALVIGGESRQKQSADLEQGSHIVVATPGRLFDHMQTKHFDYRHVQCLILDEADKILQYGFEEDLKQIINRLPKNRQTMLFSATHSEKMEQLTKSAMRDNVVFINSSEDNAMATVDGLKHGYVLCKTEDRLWWLFKVLKKTRKQKVMIFFSSCKSVEFHHRFFNEYCNAPVMCIHGKMNQSERTATMSEFYSANSGALFCTDVAARGLDIPAVDWVIQFDPPADTNEYIHRVGRTARGEGASGNAVLLLRPEEREFLQHLNEAKVYLELYRMWDDFSSYQDMLEESVKNNKDFHKLSVEAFESYLRAFEVRRLKNVFSTRSLDLEAVARSFGLREKPDVDICMGFKKKHRARKRMATTIEQSNIKTTKL